MEPTTDRQSTPSMGQMILSSKSQTTVDQYGPSVDLWTVSRHTVHQLTPSIRQLTFHSHSQTTLDHYGPSIDLCSVSDFDNFSVRGLFFFSYFIQTLRCLDTKS